MIGFYGIFAGEKYLNQTTRHDNLDKMLSCINKDDFIYDTIQGKNFSIGLVKRISGNNKDLSLKCIDDNLTIGFNGYGRIKGESRYSWAEDMIEKIICLLQNDGESSLVKIEGSFQCVLISYDKLSLISDRFSSKTLYYHDEADFFVCAPEMISLLNSGMVEKKKNTNGVIQIMLSGFFTGNETLAKNIFRLPGATILKKDVSRPSNIGLSIYWRFPENEGAIDSITDELIEKFANKYYNSIHNLAGLEKNSIVTLSGGLDSRAISCFLSKIQNHHLQNLTYDMGDEIRIAKKVSRVLDASQAYFSNEMIASKYFQDSIFKIINSQNFHVVPNQYFYAPLFKQFFTENKEFKGLYDGVYLDGPFNTNDHYTCSNFDYNRFVAIYCRGRNDLLNYSRSITESDLDRIIMSEYSQIWNNYKKCDPITLSDAFYNFGRLRRYVNESSSSRENYCYVFKPGYDYDLVDFGFELNLSLRKGKLYNTMLNKKFPEVMKIPYKDSYGNRSKSLFEKLYANYKFIRSKIASHSMGLLKYSQYQLDYYFIDKNRLDDFQEAFFGKNYINDIFNDSVLRQLFNKVKHKPYLLNFVQRVLFTQTFYKKIGL